MTKDIVNRVREKCHAEGIPQESIETFLEAADEIENLRVKMSKIKELLQDVLREAYRG